MKKFIVYAIACIMSFVVQSPVLALEKSIDLNKDGIDFDSGSRTYNFTALLIFYLRVPPPKPSQCKEVLHCASALPLILKRYLDI